MATLAGSPKPEYTISLFISEKVKAHSVKEGQYDTREFPGKTRELARVELRGEDLAAMLSDTKEHIDLVRVP